MKDFKIKVIKHRKPSVLYVNPTLEDLDGETWYPLTHFENLYLISNYSRIKRLPRVKTGKMDSFSKRTFIVRPKLCRGYLQVALSKFGESPKLYYLHRLVAETFIDNPNNYQYVNHKDENKLNNSIDNLEWCTASYNNSYNGRAIKAAAYRKIDLYVYKYDGKTNSFKFYKYFDKISDCKLLSIGYPTVMKYLDTNKPYVALTRDMYKFYSNDNK